MCAAWLLPSALGYERYVITGGSMSGTFERGSVAFEKEVPVDTLRRGDVITYLPPATPASRTWSRTASSPSSPPEGGGLLYRTQGDANPDPDPWRFELTEPTQPVVEHTVPLVGHAFIALADRDTRMLLDRRPGRPHRPAGPRRARQGPPPPSCDDEAASAAPVHLAGPAPVVPGQTRGEPAARPQGVPPQA